MTPEQNVLAAAVQLMWAAERYGACLVEFDDPAACGEWAESQDEAMRHLDTAIQVAGIDWRDPAVREQLRTVGVSEHGPQCGPTPELLRGMLDREVARTARLGDAIFAIVRAMDRGELERHPLLTALQDVYFEAVPKGLSERRS